MLKAWIPEEDMTPDQLEIQRISETWNQVRLMTDEELDQAIAAGSVEAKWKESLQRYNEKYQKDMEHMLQITDKVQKMIEPPKVAKKTKGQKKRDKWAIVQAREQARALAN
jgi:hypothetical protein